LITIPEEKKEADSEIPPDWETQKAKGETIQKQSLSLLLSKMAV